MSMILVTAPYGRTHDSWPNRAKLLHLLLLSTVTFQMITGLLEDMQILLKKRQDS